MVNEITEAVDKIAQAQMAADRLERENAKFEESIKKMEALATRNILGGKSVASEPEAVKKVETPQEYAKKALRGEV